MHNFVIDVHSIYDEICTVTEVNPFYDKIFSSWMYVAFVITCCPISLTDGVCHVGSWHVCWRGRPHGMTRVVRTWTRHVSRWHGTWHDSCWRGKRHVSCWHGHLLTWRGTRVGFVGCHMSFLNGATWHPVICYRFRHRSYYAIVTEHKIKSS